MGQCCFSWSVCVDSCEQLLVLSVGVQVHPASVSCVDLSYIIL